MIDAVLGLGGNIGDTRKEMSAALSRLNRDPKITIVAVSALYLTPPWGKTDQPPFLNAAARIDTGLPPRSLLNAILDVERDLGRERLERWGPRTIDIDILTYGAIDIDEPWLHVPHPRLTERAFALMPLVDVMPDAVIKGRGAKDWLARVDLQGITKIADADWYKVDGHKRIVILGRSEAETREPRFHRLPLYSGLAARARG